MEAPYAPPAYYKDRRTGLIIFGIALIAFGGFLLLLAPVGAIGQVMAARVTGESNLGMGVLTLVMYGLGGALFITLGIGSIKGRRWARAIILVISWFWLGVGALTLATFLWFGPKMFSAVVQVEGDAVPPDMQGILMGMAVGFLGLFFIVLPGVLVLFYRSWHVKATVEAMDPQPRWTDACPLPVLGASLLAAYGAFALLTMPIAYKGAIPIAGVILTGFVGSLVWLVLASVLAYVAWSLYHVRLIGWWIMMAMSVFATISNALTFSRVNLPTLYRHMGYPEAQIEQMERYNIFTPTQMIIVSAAFIVPLVGYLVFIKKYFRPHKPVQLTPVAA